MSVVFAEKTCAVCGKTFRPRNVVQKICADRDCQKARQRTRQRAYRQTPKGKAYQRAYRQTPQHKARNRAHQRAYRQTPKYKARERAPQYKVCARAYQQKYRQTPEYKARKRAHRARRRLERAHATFLSLLFTLAKELTNE